MQQTKKCNFEKWNPELHGRNDNTEVIAFAKENEGYTIGIDSLGSSDTIAPAVTKGNTSLLDWLNEEIETFGKREIFP